MTPSPPPSPPRTAGPPAGLARFNASARPDAAAALHEVCVCPEWAGGVLAGRPYPDAEALLAASDRAVAALTPEQLARAVAGHPPIGRPRPGDPVSAGEQRGMTGAAAGLRAEMLELNLAYQRRFGHVFLICATGLTAERMRDAVRLRIGNPPEREQEIVRTELAGINRLRLARLLTAAPGPAGRPREERA
ncbi:2-oxo-4-hydroxy-4-carboxy-5-ureidoimidazoline decarboxylase [Streptomyces sp. NPDC014894]|uniref:2-oxo-4-hydroxy-4-carboxy-5-ureidoimidazoline decarboxylase n=1 Tax=Streptomyces sp. NPDC014894 TaxID=3364931 RepID=UPI0036F95EFA